MPAKEASSPALAVKLFIVGWLGLALAGALNHTILPQLDLRMNLDSVPPLRYGYVMFNKAPERVSVVSVQLADVPEWQPLAALVGTPAPLYRNTRIQIDYWMSGFTYLNHLCATRGRAQEARFMIQDHAPGRETPLHTEYYRCTQGHMLRDFAR